MSRAAPVGLVVLLAIVAEAAPRELSRAKALFERGRVAFGRGDYAQAAELFRAGHQLAPRPLFLFNTAQALRKLAEATGEAPESLGAARAEYRRYIDAAPPDEPERVDALRHLLELEEKLAALSALAAKPEAAPPPEARLVPPPSAPTPTPSAGPELVRSSGPPPPAGERPWLERHGVWLGVAAGAVVAGAAAVGVWSATACHASLGCVDARR